MGQFARAEHLRSAFAKNVRDQYAEHIAACGKAYASAATTIAKSGLNGTVGFRESNKPGVQQ